MSHFSAEQWFDYVGKIGPSEVFAPIERHLTEGCGECKELFEFWKEVLEIAQREASFRPSDALVESVKEAFKPEDNWRWFPQIAQLAKLLFDSLQASIPAAVRGPTSGSRQLLQEAKPFVIDLRLEHEPARKRTRVIGQVLNSEEPAKNVTDVDIFLLDGERLVARTAVNDSGEFQMEFVEEEGLQLFVDIRARKIVEILLPHSIAKEKAAAGQ